MTIASRRERIYNALPDPVTGYELNPDFSPFTIIVPEDTVNLVTNPSVEGKVTTGYAAVGGAMAADYGWQAYGACGLKLTPAVSTESGFYFGTVAMAAGSTYTASITIQGEAGKIYYIYFATTAGALLGSKRAWVGTGHKQRIFVTYAESSSTTRRIYVTRSAQYTDQHIFYADGLQVEEKPYPTTFVDGSLTGFVLNQVDFYWNGTPGASTSTRTAQTRAGGREVNILDFGFRVLAIVGLGMATLVDQSLPMPGRGELAQGTGTTSREFSLVGALNFDTPRHGQALRDALINVFKPDATVLEQPMILRYQACDDEGVQTGESLDIICKYRSGLEGNINNNNGERLALTFKQYIPFMRGTYSGGVELGYQQTIANANGILMRSSAMGQWQAMGTGANVGPVSAIVEMPDGSIIVGGNFAQMGGVANTAYISRWNGSAWSALGTGTNGQVYALSLAPNGDLYVGGAFTGAGGVANTTHIAKWNGSVWSPLGTGMDGTVRSLLFADYGTMYTGGLFTTAGGVTAKGIAQWDGSVWTSVGDGTLAGFAAGVYSLAMWPGTYLYVGGSFTAIGGVTAANIARFSLLTSTWLPLDTGTNGAVFVLTFGRDVSLYVGGAFTSAGGVPAYHIARWNGSFWYSLGYGSGNGVSGTAGPQVLSMAFDTNNDLYVGGTFLTAGGVPIVDSSAIWNGSYWSPLDVDLPGTPDYVSVIIFDKNRNLYFGFNDTGSAISATVTVTNSGTTVSYPVVTFTGPGTLRQLKNYTTGKSIYFDLTLLAGEVAVLSLDPMHISFTSSFRGNIFSTILPGSNLIFPLQPGANNISTYLYGSTSAASAITMSLVYAYWSIDGAVFK